MTGVDSSELHRRPWVSCPNPGPFLISWRAAFVAHFGGATMNIPSSDPRQSDPPAQDNDRPASESAGDDELLLRPPECPSSADFRRRFERTELPPTDVPPPDPRFQFSLVELMVITLGVAVGLAGGTWMPPSMFAGVMSILAMAGLLAIHFYPPESRSGWLVWATVFLAYFVAVVVAIMRPAPG